MDDIWDDVVKSAVVPSVVIEAPAAPTNPAWQAPPPSTSRQTWTPPSFAIEEKNGVIWSPMLRALIHPRRGGIAVPIRPLPTLDEAWARFRRAAWADDRIGMERKKSLSTIWSWVTSFDAAQRKIGERLCAIEPRQGDLAENVALASATLERYRQFPANFHQELWDSLADFFVASSGLVDAIRAAYLGVGSELPYMQMGLFGRIRELLVLADDAAYATARSAILESHETEVAKSKGSTHREPDLKWATTFLLPLGPAAKDEEKRIHQDALAHLSKFGDFGQHAAGLAAGDGATLERYLRANKGVRHEFFAGTPRRYIASMLDVDPEGAAPLLAKMKLASPFADSAAENTRWMDIVAHIDREEAFEAMWQERNSEVSATWGIAALLMASRLNFERVLAFAKRTKNDAELVAMIEKEKGKAPEEPSHEWSDATVEPLAAPSAYVPPTAVRPALLANPLRLEPEVAWHESETENAEYVNDRVTWNDAPIRTLAAADLDAFVAHAEKWALPSYLSVIATAPSRVHPRLFALGFDMRQAYWANYCLRPIAVKNGAFAIDPIVACLQHGETFEAALVAAQGIGDVSIAPSMIESFAGKKYKVGGRAWMLRHPRHAAAGALEMFSKKDAKDGALAAARALRFLDMRGHRDAIVDFASRMNIQDAVIEMLDRDPLTQPKVKKPTVPQYVDASKLPALVTSSGKAATHEEVERLLVELAFSNADEIHPGVLAAKRLYTSASRAAFAWEIFEAWLAAGADPKASWCMQAVGFLGDDDGARKLAALAKLWPGQGFGARAQAALDALLNIGTDTALVNINILAEKSRFPAFKQAAGERILAIADARGLTSDELADRLVPTLGLDEEEGGALDFGARKFTVAFDERMLPIVRDASGALLGDLPKASKADDAAKAKAAKAKLAALKKDAKTTASLQVSRMERAMKNGRHIGRALFLEAFAAHPWMRHLAQRLVWGAHDASGAIVRTFRVAEDGTLADEKDAEYKLPADATVSAVHPARAPKNAWDAWSALFAEYRIIQPFPQIARPTFDATNEERGARTLERFRGRKTSYGALRGLESRGWQKWMDDAVVFAKIVGPHRQYVMLHTDPGWHPSQTADDIEPQTLGDVTLSSENFGALDRVIFSELVYDLETLAEEKPS